MEATSSSQEREREIELRVGEICRDRDWGRQMETERDIYIYTERDWGERYGKKSSGGRRAKDGARGRWRDSDRGRWRERWGEREGGGAKDVGRERLG